MLSVSASFGPDPGTRTRWSSTPSERIDPIEKAKSALTDTLDALASGNAAQQGRHTEEGVLREWTDGFRPKFAGDEFQPVGSGLHVLKAGRSAIFTFIDSSSGDLVWRQATPMPLMEGPIRFHASPVPGVALHLGPNAPSGLAVRLDSLLWRGAHVAYLVADSAIVSVDRSASNNPYRWVWSVFASLTLVVFLLWMRSVAPERIAIWFPSFSWRCCLSG